MNRKLFHHLLEFGELHTPQSRQSSSENGRLPPDEGRVGYNNTSLYPTQKGRKGAIYAAIRAAIQIFSLRRGDTSNYRGEHSNQRRQRTYHQTAGRSRGASTTDKRSTGIIR